MARIILLAEEKCAASALTGSVDAFSMANLMGIFTGRTKPLFHIQIVTLDGRPVHASGGFEIRPEGSVRDAGDSDLILLPAFFPPFDLENRRIDELCEWLRYRHQDGQRLVATCTGSFFLARTGLLDGRRATVNWLFEGMFRRLHPRVNLLTDRIMVEDARLVTTGAATAFLNMCLHFIEEYGDPELAARCSRSLLIDPERQSQAPYMIHDFWKHHGDDGILAAQTLMEKAYTENISIEDVAEKVGISQRHFKRRFKKATGDTPIAYLQHLRIENAKKLLENSRESVNEITWKVGYEDINSFRRLFRRHTGMSPKGYREKYARFARKAS
ncbi:MAG: helix-turn-helix domain-containing protein [Thermodesulfobacteriota bacterium]